MPSIADVIDLIAAALPSVTVRFGQEYQNENEAPPRLVFVPRGDRFMPASSRASAPVVRSIHSSLATRAIGLEARIWAAADPDADPVPSYADLRAAELLVDKVIHAIHTVCSGSYALEDGEWMDTSHAQAGRLYLLRLRIMVPVVPTDDDATVAKTTWTDVESGADVPEAGALPATTSTMELGTDETGVPSP